MVEYSTSYFVAVVSVYFDIFSQGWSKWTRRLILAYGTIWWVSRSDESSTAWAFPWPGNAACVLYPKTISRRYDWNSLEHLYGLVRHSIQLIFIVANLIWVVFGLKQVYANNFSVQNFQMGTLDEWPSFCHSLQCCSLCLILGNVFSEFGSKSFLCLLLFFFFYMY